MEQDNDNDDQQHPYQRLTPDTVLDAIESTGRMCNGRLLALNSYENRVYQIGIEDQEPLVVKFYRPERWSDEAIAEEHRFTLQLSEQELPVISPIVDDSGQTLFTHAGFRFSLYPRKGGHGPDLDQPGHREWMGRLIARIHAIGATEQFEHRPVLTVQEYGKKEHQFLLEMDFIPPELRQSYQTLASDIFDLIDQRYEWAGPYRAIRLHGDCHPGNVLWTDDGPHFVDFDDSRSGPAMQDIWMLLSGPEHERQAQFAEVMEGYEKFFSFDYQQLQLIEPLRTLRMIHHSAWLAKRWRDPAFPAAFPWFNSRRYWEDHILNLREQMSNMQDPALQAL